MEAKEEARKYREEVDAEFKSERQELKQIESRLTERATSLDRKDDNLTSKEQTLEQKEQSISDRAKNLDAREEQLEEVERQKRSRARAYWCSVSGRSTRYYLGSDRGKLDQGDCQPYS